MKPSSLLRSFAVSCVLAIAGAFALLAECAGAVVIRARIAARSIAQAAIRLAPAKAGEVVHVAPRVQIVRARAAVARMFKRQVPWLTPGWRMCPSI